MGTNAKKFKRNLHQAIAITVLVALAVLGYRYLGSFSEDEQATVVFEIPGKSKSPEYSLRVARDPETREKGLMYVKSLGEREGMVFVYPREQELTFWMKNTYVPLDMIFIDASMNVIGILHDVPVLTTDIRTVKKPSRIAVELLAGEAKKHGIVEGSHAVFSHNVR